MCVQFAVHVKFVAGLGQNQTDQNIDWSLAWPQPTPQTLNRFSSVLLPPCKLQGASKIPAAS